MRGTVFSVFPMPALYGFKFFRFPNKAENQVSQKNSGIKHAAISVFRFGKCGECTIMKSLFFSSTDTHEGMKDRNELIDIARIRGALRFLKNGYFFSHCVENFSDKLSGCRRVAQIRICQITLAVFAFTVHSQSSRTDTTLRRFIEKAEIF